MKSRLMHLTFVAVFLFISLIPSQAVKARLKIDADAAQFYDALRPYGKWVSHSIYGTVWYPTHVPRNWRPYTDGHWAYTQQYGWLWVSDQPWGWAPFHYGRWAWDSWYGWIWVPGRTWAPAWVFWRSGGGYAAWAPMPPNVLWQTNYGLDTRYFNYDRDLHWDCWVAVPEYHLPNRHMHQHIFAPNQNQHIIRNTNHINNLTVINQSIVNQGVPVTQIEHLTGTPVTAVVPFVNENLEKHPGRHHKAENPEIIRPIPADITSPDELRKHEEIAVKLDQDKVIDRAPPTASESLLNSDYQEQPRVPERLNKEHTTNHRPHQVPNSLAGPELIQPVGPALTEELPASPPAATSEVTRHPDVAIPTANQDTIPEAIQPSNIEGQPAAIPVTPIYFSPSSDPAPSQSPEQNLFAPQVEATPLPILQDQHSIETPPSEPDLKQEPPAHAHEEPIVNQQAIEPQTISGQETVQSIPTSPQQPEITVIQDPQNQPPVETLPAPVEVPPVQTQEPLPVPVPMDNQPLDIPAVQEPQVEPAIQISQPEPAPQPEIPSQPAIEAQQQPEPPHQPDPPPAPPQEVPSQPKNSCQPTDQNDCSK